MTGYLAAYVVAVGAMIFAALSAVTLITIVSHLDPPARVDAPADRIPKKDRGLTRRGGVRAIHRRAART
jgi:hypothetical protein